MADAEGHVDGRQSRNHDDSMPAGPQGCSGPGRYAFTVEGPRVHFVLGADDCTPRRMILDGSTWVPSGTAPPPVERRIAVTYRGTRPALPRATASSDGWPSFRGPLGVGRRRGPAPARPLESFERRGDPVASRDSRPRPLQSRRLGRPRLRDERHQQPRAMRASSPASTAMAMPPTISHAIAGCSTRWIGRPAAFAGSASPPKASRGTSGTSSRRTRAQRRPPTGALSSRGSARRASSPTT